jgi:hypothetical protein
LRARHRAERAATWQHGVFAIGRGQRVRLAFSARDVQGVVTASVSTVFGRQIFRNGDVSTRRLSFKGILK